MIPIILASTSPRRAELLKQIGIEFTAYASNLDEEQIISDTPAKMVMDLALAKAQKVASSVKNGLIIGSDTIVVTENQILGKPAGSKDAKAMLTKLSGKIHSVFTGLALIKQPGNKIMVDFEETEVKFRRLTPSEIEAYVAAGEPLDKAGAYGIQGKGAVLVEGINGCYFNVVGLPIAKLVTMLKEFGISVF